MLSEKIAKEAKPTDKPQKLPHEKGLYLYISPKGGKSWRFDYRFDVARLLVRIVRLFQEGQPA